MKTKFKKKRKKNTDAVFVIGMLFVLIVTVYVMLNPSTYEERRLEPAGKPTVATTTTPLNETESNQTVPKTEV